MGRVHVHILPCYASHMMWFLPADTRYIRIRYIMRTPHKNQDQSNTRVSHRISRTHVHTRKPFCWDVAIRNSLRSNNIVHIVEKLIKRSPEGSRAQKYRKRRKPFPYLVPGMYLVPPRLLSLLLFLLCLRYYVLGESIQWAPGFKKYPVKKVSHIW